MAVDHVRSQYYPLTIMKFDAKQTIPGLLLTPLRSYLEN